MKASIKWLDGMAFSARAGSGHSVTVDGPPDIGGRDRGPRPMEMILLGLGSCSAVDVLHILQRGRHPVADCEVDIDADRADKPPRVFTRIHLHYRVSGEGLSEAAVQRAARLSAEKYCSASIMLSQAVTITHDVTIVDAAAGAG